MESTYEPETTEEITSTEEDVYDEPESDAPEEVESAVEYDEEDSVSVSENEIETEVNSDLVFLIMNWRKYDRKSEETRGGLCSGFDGTGSAGE